MIFHFGNFKVFCVSFDLVYLYFFQDCFILQNSFLSKRAPKLSFCYSQNRGWRKQLIPENVLNIFQKRQDSKLVLLKTHQANLSGNMSSSQSAFKAS